MLRVTIRVRANATVTVIVKDSVTDTVMGGGL